MGFIGGEREGWVGVWVWLMDVWGIVAAGSLT